MKSIWATGVGAIALVLSVGPWSSNAPSDAHASSRAPGNTAWHNIGLTGTVVNALAVGTKRGARAFAGTTAGLYRRTSGRHWQRVLRTDSVTSVQFLADDRTVLAGDLSGFVDISRDGGSHWKQQLVSPLGVTSVAAQPGSRGRTILAAATGGIYLSRDGGTHWQQRYTLKDGAAVSLAWAPGSHTVAFAGSAVTNGAKRSHGVLYSTNGGQTWRPFGSGLNDGGAVMSLTVTPDRVYVGTMGNAVWQATMSLKAWKRESAGMPEIDDHGSSLVAIPGHAGTLYVGTMGYGVYRTTDAGKHWSALSAGLSADNSSTVVRALSYSPASRTVLAGTDNGVYEVSVG